MIRGLTSERAYAERDIELRGQDFERFVTYYSTQEENDDAIKHAAAMTENGITVKMDQYIDQVGYTIQ